MRGRSGPYTATPEIDAENAPSAYTLLGRHLHNANTEMVSRTSLLAYVPEGEAAAKLMEVQELRVTGCCWTLNSAWFRGSFRHTRPFLILTLEDSTRTHTLQHHLLSEGFQRLPMALQCLANTWTQSPRSYPQGRWLPVPHSSPIVENSPIINAALSQIKS